MLAKLKREEKILLYGSSIWYLGEGMLGPLLVVFADRIGGDILEIAWAWSIYLIVSGAATVLVGSFSDRYDKGKIMIAGYALNALCTFGYILVSTPYQLFVLQALLGLATALATPTWDALYAKHSHGRQTEGNAWGLAEGMPDIITGIAILIGGLVITRFSFDALFVIMGMIQVVATVVQAAILKKT